MNDTTITRRSALRTGGLAAIAAGLLGAAGARPQPVAGAPLAPAADIDHAEALLLEVERILLALPEESRLDLSFELSRLTDLGTAADPAAYAAENERMTGANRMSVADPISVGD